LKIEIGDKSLLHSTPSLIKISSDFYILSKDSDGHPILFSADCPHQHGIVEELNDESWNCPNHNWSFNPTNGKCINAPQESLQTFPVIIEKTKLFAELPENKTLESLSSVGKKIFPKITLVSNACLLIEWNGKNILTDPWIVGPAIYGSWIHYPPTELKIMDLPKIDFIIISHEHTDHFNEKTLSLMNKDIPIYVPHYKIGRLAQRAKNLGFNNIFSIPSEKIINLNDDMKLIFFKPNSLWNDSVIYLQLGNFKILNINDAGFNWNIPKLVGDIDLVCSAFSFGASAYPLNWTHLDTSSKIEIMKTKNLGMLKMLKQIAELCNAKYLLPFANFNELGPTKLRSIAKLQIKNTPRTITNFFKNHPLKILELLPGESWDGKSGKILERNEREKFFDRENTLKYLDENYHNDTNQEFIPKNFTLTHEDLKDYFEKFSGSELSKQVGIYSVMLTAFNEKIKLNGKISFIDGRIEYESDPILDDTNMNMICPGAIIQDIVQKDLSWDEIQYWSEYSRKNEEYNIAFWKILHAPWEARNNSFMDTSDFVNKNTAIATLLEKGGKEVNALFEEFGLYCASCDASIGENLEEGCKMHGLTEDSTHKLILKINELLKKNQEN
jgi:CMP-N-acetylneuraminate monooxygenase